MFVQVIEGRAADAALLRRQFERWEAELRPGATGFLGSTGGVAADGTVFVMARFASEAEARANSDRPEQGAWWQETAKGFASDPSFRDTTDVVEFLGGGSDDAGFVQVIECRVKDRERYRTLNDELQPALREHRPDVLGGVELWFGDDLVDVVYFQSEAAARDGEGKERPAELAAVFEEYLSLVEGARYIDLTEPWLR